MKLSLKKVVLCRILVIALLFCITAVSVIAEEDFALSSDFSEDSWELTGFITLGYNNADKYDAPSLVRRGTQGTEKGREQPWRLDSNIGLQFKKPFWDDFEFVSQILFKERNSNNLRYLEDSIEMAFLRYKHHSGFELSVGRLPFTTYALSDHLNVGYSYHWVRPPIEYYAWIPYSYYDGVNLAYEWGDWDNMVRIEAFAGQAEADIFAEFEEQIKAKPVLGGGITWNKGDLELRANFVYLELPDNVRSVKVLDPLRNLSPIWPEINSIVDDLQIDGTEVFYGGLGLEYSKNDWLIKSEYSYIDSEGVTYEGHRFYVSLAKRFGKWQPHITWSKSWDDRSTKSYPAPPSGFGLESLQERLQNESHVDIVDQSTVSLGLRYDFAENMALKFQWDITKVDDNALGVFDSYKDDDTLDGGTFNWWSVTFEWVF